MGKSKLLTCLVKTVRLSNLKMLMERKVQLFILTTATRRYDGACGRERWGRDADGL